MIVEKKKCEDESHAQSQSFNDVSKLSARLAQQFANDTASTFIGMADSAFFGQYGKLTEALGIGPIDKNLAYNAGQGGAFAFSALRLAYAGSAFAIRYVPGISASEAVAARNGLKGVFSALGADHPRAYTVEQLLVTYGSDAAVVKAASRTDSGLNSVAAAAASSSGAQLASSCP